MIDGVAVGPATCEMKTFAAYTSVLSSLESVFNLAFVLMMIHGRWFTTSN